MLKRLMAYLGLVTSPMPLLNDNDRRNERRRPASVAHGTARQFKWHALRKERIEKGLPVSGFVRKVLRARIWS